MKKLIAITLLAAAFYGCGEKETSTGNIPETFVEKANQFVISKTGEDFFNEYIKFDAVNSKIDSPYYLIKYSFQIPEKDFVDEEISFYLNDKGEVATFRKVIGIPNCANDPKACDFTVDKAKAIKLAEEVGVTEEYGELNTDFTWSESQEKYVWLVQILDPEYTFGKKGQEVIIDASNGIVLEKRIGNLD